MDRVENRSNISKLKACLESVVYINVRDYFKYRKELASCSDPKRRKWLEKAVVKEYKNTRIDEIDRYLSIKGEIDLREIIDKYYSKTELTEEEKGLVSNYFYFSNYALYSKSIKFLEDSSSYSEIVAYFKIDFKPSEIKILEEINRKYNKQSNKSFNEQVIDEINYQLPKLGITSAIKRLEELSSELDSDKSFIEKIKIKNEMKKLRRKVDSEPWELETYQNFVNELKLRITIKKYLNSEPITCEELHVVKDFITYRFQTVRRLEEGKGTETVYEYLPHCHQFAKKTIPNSKIVSEKIDTNKVFSDEELRVLNKIYKEGSSSL